MEEASAASGMDTNSTLAAFAALPEFDIFSLGKFLENFNADQFLSRNIVYDYSMTLTNYPPKKSGLSDYCNVTQKCNASAVKKLAEEYVYSLVFLRRSVGISWSL